MRVNPFAVKSPLCLEQSPSPSQGEIKRGSQGEGEQPVPSFLHIAVKSPLPRAISPPSQGERGSEGEPVPRAKPRHSRAGANPEGRDRVHPLSLDGTCAKPLSIGGFDG